MEQCRFVGAAGDILTRLAVARLNCCVRRIVSLTEVKNVGAIEVVDIDGSSDISCEVVDLALDVGFDVVRNIGKESSVPVTGVEDGSVSNHGRVKLRL